MQDRLRVKIIDKTDELYGLVGEVLAIRGHEQLLIYFPEDRMTFPYHESQVETVPYDE